MPHGGGWIFSQNVCSLALTVWDRQWTKGWLNQWIYESMNELKGDCRTAPARPGLLIKIL